MKRRELIGSLISLAGLGFLLKDKSRPENIEAVFPDGSRKKLKFGKTVIFKAGELESIANKLSKCKINPNNAFDAFINQKQSL